MKAMILAAGKGTRMRPLTDLKPKALLEVAGVPLLEHTIMYLQHYGVKEIIVNVHHHAEQVIDFIKGIRSKHDVEVSVSDESDQLLDTGGGLVKASWYFNDGLPFILTACDVMTDLDLSAMYADHLKKRPVATLAVKQRKSTRDLLFDDDYRLCGWRNNVNGDVRMAFNVDNPIGLAFSTVHVIEPEIFKLLDQERVGRPHAHPAGLSLQTKPGVFSMTEAYLKIAGDHPVMGYVHDDSQWLEFGRIENLNNPETRDIIQEIYTKYH